MTPTIRDGTIALFTPKGFLDSTNAPNQITVQDVNFVLQRPYIHLVLISLRQVFEYNPGGIGYLVQILHQIRDRMGVEIGFCDYQTPANYTKLQRMVVDAPDIFLFSNETIALLLMSHSPKPLSGSVLVLDIAEDQTRRICMALHRRGYATDVEKNLTTFQQKQFDKRHYALSVGPTRLAGSDEKIASHRHGMFVIYTLGSVFDSSIESQFDYLQHAKLLEIGYRFFILDGSIIRSMNTNGARFVSKIAKSVILHGGVIILSGLTRALHTHPLLETLKSKGVVIYPDILDVLYDKMLLQQLFATEGVAALTKRYKGVGKEITSRLKGIVGNILKSLSTLINLPITLQGASAGALPIDWSETDQLHACSVGLMQGLSCELYLILHAETASRARSLFLGEQVEYQFAGVDVLSEILQCVGYRLRSYFNTEGIGVSLTLPKAFGAPSEMQRIIKNKQGVVVRLDIDSAPAYLLVSQS